MMMMNFFYKTKIESLLRYEKNRSRENITVKQKKNEQQNKKHNLGVLLLNSFHHSVYSLLFLFIFFSLRQDSKNKLKE